MRSLVCLGALPALLVPCLQAQNFTASMVANQPIEVDFTGVATQPAGPLTGNVSLSRQTQLAGVTMTASLGLVLPTASDLSCRFDTTLDTGSLPGSWWPAVFRADTTLSITGPAGQWGTVEIRVQSNDNPWPTVDVGNDGTIENTAGQFYGGISSGTLTRSWSVPVQLTAAPLPIRIVHPLQPRNSYFFQQFEVRFVPWAANATDLGSGCTENHTGWIIGDNVTRPYSLSVRPGTGGAAAMLHARGHGPLQAFVLASQPGRLPTGTIPFGIGCDDLFLNVIATTPGTPAPFTTDSEWTLDVPALPPGLDFYLQHVSFDPVFGWSVPVGYFGVTNAVRYQT